MSFIRWPTGITTQTNCHDTNKYSDGTNKLLKARTNIVTARTNIATPQTNIAMATAQKLFTAEVTFFVRSGRGTLTSILKASQTWKACCKQSKLKMQKNNDVLLPLWRVCRRISQLLYEVWKRYAIFSK